MKNLTTLALEAGLKDFSTEIPDYWVADMQKQFGVDPRGGKLNGEVVWIVWSFNEYVALGEPFPLSPGAEKLLALWETRKAANAALHRQNSVGRERLEYEKFERTPPRFEKAPYEFERTLRRFEEEEPIKEYSVRELHEEDAKE